MKYFIDTEFIEDGKTIDLISLGIVSEDNRTLYLQNAECEFAKAGDWVWRNVFPHLLHFDMRGRRKCDQQAQSCDSGLGTRKITRCSVGRFQSRPPTEETFCPWATRLEMSKEAIEFCDQEKYGKPEFWGYYADYDWVAFCQLFGRMIELPKGYPMYCRDIKQEADMAANHIELPKQTSAEHNALSDAIWTKQAFEFLQEKGFIKKPKGK